MATDTEQKAEVDLRELREPTCIECRHFQVKGIWEYCELHETTTTGKICHAFCQPTLPE